MYLIKAVVFLKYTPLLFMFDKVYFENVLRNRFLSFSFRPDFNDSRYDQVTLIFFSANRIFES